MSHSIKKNTLLILLTTVALFACSEKTTEETAGEKLDKALQVTQDKAAEAKRKADEAYEDAKDASADAYDATQEKAAELSAEAKAELKAACEKTKEKLGTEDKDC